MLGSSAPIHAFFHLTFSHVCDSALSTRLAQRPLADEVGTLQSFLSGVPFVSSIMHHHQDMPRALLSVHRRPAQYFFAAIRMLCQRLERLEAGTGHSPLTTRTSCMQPQCLFFHFINSRFRVGHGHWPDSRCLSMQCCWPGTEDKDDDVLYNRRREWLTFRLVDSANRKLCGVERRVRFFVLLLCPVADG